MIIYPFYAILAYLIGSIPVGIILSKFKGKDPRQVGSGNIGATNVMRTAGKLMGALTLIGDTAKGFLPVFFIQYGEKNMVLIAFIGFAVFIGHLYPIYLKFRGGKGVATALGVYIALTPLAVLIDVLIFVLVVLKWRYVSLGSLIATCAMPIILLFLKMPSEFVSLSVLIGIFIFLKHSENIKRLKNGTENRVKI
ncbi:MAG TPA: glycerol-3-phosphate 1-O-acyltransferase PlsY [Syntrophorhabdaceae bacterium]|nr:glycerol-3-phosphate 1-O-acyltransferase PlsY [Syntrophorhabdaceae bacterium]